MSLEKLIGLPLDKAMELTNRQNVNITDFSRPDKYHSETKASLRVVKAVKNDNGIELFVAGFKDYI